MKEAVAYHAAVYLRLSREDEDMNENKVQSNSIASQKEMICSFIRKQEDIEIYHIYIEMKIVYLIQKNCCR